MVIDNMVTCVSQVRCFEGDKQIGLASGFFYMHSEKLYFITNRHVVIKEEEDYYPDELRLRLHTSREDVRQNADYSVSLYGADSKRAWREHPREGKRIDVVAIPLSTQEVISKYVVKSFSEADHVPNRVDVAVGDDVLVIGYPLGFYDEVHNLPIVRNATVASVYPVPFEGEPLVVVDARLHKATSGSPVITKPGNILRFRGGNVAVHTGMVRYLLGVHSAEFDVVRRVPKVDEPLGLNAVWFASLIPEIIAERA